MVPNPFEKYRFRHQASFPVIPHHTDWHREINLFESSVFVIPYLFFSLAEALQKAIDEDVKRLEVANEQEQELILKKLGIVVR